MNADGLPPEATAAAVAGAAAAAVPGPTVDADAVVDEGPAVDEGAVARETAAEVARLVNIVAALREHCPWTAALTHASLTEYLLEESYELLDALEHGTPAEVAGELGDVLFQVVVHARLGQEAGLFDLAAVTRGLSAKMIRRNPHVFQPDGSLQASFPATVAEIVETWDAVKRAERAAAEHVPDLTAPHPAYAGIPAALPALALAQKTLDRAERGGRALGGVAPSPLLDSDAGETELGDLLLELVREARGRGLDAERSLRAAIHRFQRQ